MKANVGNVGKTNNLFLNHFNIEGYWHCYDLTNSTSLGQK